MDKATGAGYILNTGTTAANASKFQHLVTIDSPGGGAVVASTLTPQGIFFLSVERAQPYWYQIPEPVDGNYLFRISTLPMPGGDAGISYEKAAKQTYRWKSKKFVMPGRTTFAAAKVVMDKGCVRLRLHVDGCCRYDAVVQNCAPFRLVDQLVGTELEIELIGTATIHEVHVASTIEELVRVR